MDWPLDSWGMPAYSGSVVPRTLTWHVPTRIMLENLISLILLASIGVIVLVGIGVFIQLRQQRDARKEREANQHHPRHEG